MSMPDLIAVGAFVKPHGIRGEISASIDIDGYEPVAGDFVFASIDGLEVPFRILSVRTKGSGYLLTLKGVDSEDDASVLSNKPLHVESEVVDEIDSDEVYLEDLVGFTIYDGGDKIGKIEDYYEPTPENPLFVVARPDGSTFYVPASGELVNDINFENKTIDIDLPIGLVDLNSSK